MKYNFKGYALVLCTMAGPLMAAEALKPVETELKKELAISAPATVSVAGVPEIMTLETQVDSFLRNMLDENSRTVIEYAGGFIDWANPKNPITAAQRFGYVLDLLVQEPTLTMEDKRSEITRLYKRDEDYIRQATKDRAPEVSAEIDAQLTELATMVRKEMGELSFSDLNCVGRMWSTIIEQQHVNKDYWTVYLRVANKLKTTGKRMDSGAFYTRYVGSRSIILPHVSKTGSVPIRIFNESYSIPVTSTRFRSIDWLGVGTAQALSFDYFEGKGSSESWYHDYEHAIIGERFNNADSMDLRTENIGRLRAQMKLIPRGERSNQAELAFFHLFHEDQQTHEEITKTLEKMIANSTNKANNLTEAQILTGKGFFSKEQYETEIVGAKSLELTIRGETLLEKCKDLLRHLIAGYRTLQTLAHHHDSGNQERPV